MLITDIQRDLTRAGHHISPLVDDDDEDDNVDADSDADVHRNLPRVGNHLSLLVHKRCPEVEENVCRVKSNNGSKSGNLAHWLGTNPIVIKCAKMGSCFSILFC